MSTEIKNQIEKEVIKCEESIQIITAFCKNDGISFIEKQLKKGVQSKRLLVRFRMDDILAGTSDIEIFNYCKEYDWEMYIRFDLHAKTYIFDNKRCIIGSANLTNKGLVMDCGGNYEIASICDIETEDIGKVDALFDGAILMNDEIYLNMKKQLAEIDITKAKEHKWSKEIIDLFSPTIKTLFTFDFPDFESYKDYIGKNIDFLGLAADWTLQELKRTFRYSKIFLWLKLLVIENNNEMYFGAVTASLHCTLVNDPKPYRKEVKDLLARLLKWIQDLQMEEITIDIPNHSQRIMVKQRRKL